MPLVDYASSDEGSGNESEVEEDNKVVQPVQNESKSSVEKTKVSDNVNSDDNTELFTSLPKPRKTFSFLEDDNKLSKLLLNKNSLTAGGKASVKISVPSVSEFEDGAEEPAPKKIKPSAKGAGLFSVLPPPKNTTVKQTSRNLVPHVLSKNQGKQSEKRADMKNKFLKNHLKKGIDIEEDDDDTPVGTSFFGSSLLQQSTHTEYSISENRTILEASNSFTEPGQSSVSNIPIPEENCSAGLVLDNDNYSYPIDPSQATEAQVPKAASGTDNPLDLDEKALQILCGNKKKRQGMPMNVIDLSGEEILPDSKEWLLKQFTEERRVRSHSHKKHSGPSSQSRRKHQITYLAYQAKEQELELQNQWANNRMSRKQTQSKYGF